MKIKVAILEKDQQYLNRIISAISAKFSDKIEIYSFTDPDAAMTVIKDSQIDILLAHSEFELNDASIPKRCSFAYLVDEPDVASFNGRTAVCKFQRIDLFYKQILNIFAESTKSSMAYSGSQGQSKIICFSSPAGGVGTSSFAAAYSLHNAAKGLRTLYLNLEAFGSAEVFFSGEGQFCMSDMIYALKSGKASLPLKLESGVKKDYRGVCFYAPPRISLDLVEMTAEDIGRLLETLQEMGTYDRIVVDTDFSLSDKMLQVYRKASRIIWLTDGSSNANVKLSSAYQVLTVMDAKEDRPLCEKISVAYNKFSNKTGNLLNGVGIGSIGGIQRIEHAGTQQIITKIAEHDLMKALD